MSSRDSNHSTARTDASSGCFTTGDQPPRDIEWTETVKLSLPQATQKNEWKNIDVDLSFAARRIVKGASPEEELEKLDTAFLL